MKSTIITFGGCIVTTVEPRSVFWWTVSLKQEDGSLIELGDGTAENMADVIQKSQNHVLKLIERKDLRITLAEKEQTE